MAHSLDELVAQECRLNHTDVLKKGVEQMEGGSERRGHRSSRFQRAVTSGEKASRAGN